jgi:hypothetical protein
MLARARRRRRLMLLAIPLGLALFLFISLILARVFSADGAERTAITLLIRDEAAGNQAGMVSRIQDCARSPACRSGIAHDANTLKRKGEISILQLLPSAGFSLTSTVGTARVAWKTPSSLPVVQCVRVRRAGDAISGITIELLRLSARIRSSANCPRAF